MKKEFDLQEHKTKALNLEQDNKNVSMDLMNDGINRITLSYETGTIAQFRAFEDNEVFENEVFFNISRDEAIQIIKGLQNYVNGK